MKTLLSVRNLTVTAGAKKIIRSFSLSIRPGEVHVLMGPNGSGKSTLASALMGHPLYRTRATELNFSGKNLKNLTADERARLGLFLALQYPVSIPGVSLMQLLPLALEARAPLRKTASAPKQYLTLASRMSRDRAEEAQRLKTEIAQTLELLKLPEESLYRGLNDGFSGGEKKKSEILQMLALKPKLAMLDEPDSGLDVDGLKLVARAIALAKRAGTAILIITHYQRILNYLSPDRVHIMSGGALVRSGGPKLAKLVERRGYASIAH